MLEQLTLYQFIVALLMSLAGLCAFLWAAGTGLLRNVEAVKYQVLEVEEDPRREGVQPSRREEQRHE